MERLTEILTEELTAIQDLLEEGDMLVVEPMSVRLERVGLQGSAEIVAIGSQAVAAILEERHAEKD